MANEKTSAIIGITRYLPIAEKAFLLAIALDLILHYSNIDSKMLLIISVGGLAVVYYLFMYKSLDIETEEGKQYGSSELLGWSILPRTLWIGTSVSTLGILIYYLHLNNHGYFAMIGVGVSTVVISILVLCLLYFMGVKQIEKVLPILYRAIPVLIFGCYLLFVIG